MNFTKKLELISGVATFLLAIAVMWVVFRFFYEPVPLSEQKILLDELKATALLDFLPGLLVAIGAWAHALRDKTWGFILLIVGSIVIIPSSFLSFLLPVFPAGELRQNLIGIAGLMALVTLAAALIAKFRQLRSRS